MAEPVGRPDAPDQLSLVTSNTENYKIGIYMESDRRLFFRFVETLRNCGILIFYFIVHN